MEKIEMPPLPISERCITIATDDPQTPERKWLAIQLLALLNWPDDPFSREAFCQEPLMPRHVVDNIKSYINHEGVGGRDTRADLIDTLNYLQRVDRSGRPFSRVQIAGTEAVAEQVKECIKVWGLAGFRLNIMVRMALHHEDDLRSRGGASLTKATHLIVDQTKWNHTDVDAAWRIHKGVAHIAAAVVHVAYEIRSLIHKRESQTIPHWAELKLALDSRPARILQVARSLQDFVLTFRTPLSPRLINTELWLIGGPALVDLRSALPMLDSLWVERLRNLGPTRSSKRKNSLRRSGRKVAVAI